MKNYKKITYIICAVLILIVILIMLFIQIINKTNIDADDIKIDATTTKNYIRGD